MKFRATLWALERIVFFAYHFQSTAEADINLAYWAMIVAALNAIARVLFMFNPKTQSNWKGWLALNNWVPRLK